MENIRAILTYSAVLIIAFVFRQWRLWFVLSRTQT